MIIINHLLMSYELQSDNLQRMGIAYIHHAGVLLKTHYFHRQRSRSSWISLQHTLIAELRTHETFKECHTVQDKHGNKQRY